MEQGIYQMSAEAYHADPCDAPSLSSSIAQVLLAQSPAHAWLRHPKLNPEYKPDHSTRSEIGTAAHDALLEGGTAKICVIKPEDYRSKPTKADPQGAIPKGWTNGAIREARDLARSNGLVPVLPWDDATIKRMVKVAQEFIDGSEIAAEWDKGKSEQTLIWQEDTEFGPIWCRARLDRLSPRYIFDYKTVLGSADPDSFGRHMASMDYDFQGAFYARGVEKVFGRDPSPVFLAQELDAPHACSLHSLLESRLEISRAKVEAAIHLFAACLYNNSWPAYSNRIHYHEAAPWQIRAHEEKMIEEGRVFE